MKTTFKERPVIRDIKFSDLRAGDVFRLIGKHSDWRFLRTTQPPNTNGAGIWLHAGNTGMIAVQGQFCTFFANDRVVKVEAEIIFGGDV